MTDSMQRGPREIWSDWMAANEAGARDQAGALATELTLSVPESYRAWFEAGLYSKAIRDWSTCADRNSRAVDLFTPQIGEQYDGVDPAAWNLGIAATALSDWTTARRAWSAYGITGLEPGGEPIDVDYGMVPVRINPDRPSLSLQDQPHFGTTEVVWCRRRSPAHAVIVSVPLPESGHRFRDVLLHDGEPKGTRRRGEAEVSVFDELEKLQDSRIPTWQAVVEGATGDDIDALSDLADLQGLGADNWSGMNVMCSNCSHGAPDTAHQHAPAADTQTLVGLAGTESEIGDCLTQWQRGLTSVHVIDLQQLWP